MATGQQHAAASLVAASILGLTGEPAIVAGCLAGIALTPDLDQETLNHVEHKLAKTGVGWLWIALWLPYAWVIPHRHWTSHLPIVGTAIRVVYLSVWLVAAWFLVRDGFGIELGRPDWWPVVLAIGGLCISDALHWIMDGCPPLSVGKAKRVVRSAWRRRKGLRKGWLGGMKF